MSPPGFGKDGVHDSSSVRAKKIVMTTEHKEFRWKYSLLELATERNIVSRSCQILGYYRR